MINSTESIHIEEPKLLFERTRFGGDDGNASFRSAQSSRKPRGSDQRGSVEVK